MIPATAQIVLGSATLGLTGGREGAFALLDAYAEAGGQIIDTAAVYNDWVPGEIGRSEAIIGEWLRQRRGAHPFICTKGAHPPISDMKHSRLDRASITADAEASLARLGVERIDLYYLHRDDETLPVETILGRLKTLVDSGKVAAVGVSNWTPARIAEARRTGIVPIASNQVLGNVLCQHMGPRADPTTLRLDGEAFRDAEANDSSLFLYSAQCSGFFAKRKQGSEAVGVEYRTAECAKSGDAIAALASRQGVDPTALAVGFLLAYSPKIFPVVGPRTPEQLRHSLQAVELRFSPGLVAEIAAIAGFAWR